MGAWGYEINESDEFMDVYGRFFRGYNKLACRSNYDLSEEVNKITNAIISDDDWVNAYGHDLFFALGLACWETGKLSDDLLQKIIGIIEKEEYLIGWDDPKAKKKETLNFLEKIKSVNTSITLPKVDEEDKPIMVKDVLKQLMPQVLVEIIRDENKAIIIEKVKNIKDSNLLEEFVKNFYFNGNFKLIIQLEKY